MALGQDEDSAGRLGLPVPGTYLSMFLPDSTTIMDRVEAL